MRLTGRTSEGEETPYFKYIKESTIMPSKSTTRESPLSPEELLVEWEAGMRPARIQALRGDLMAVTGIYVPHRRSAINGVWYDHYRGQVTRALREAVEE